MVKSKRVATLIEKKRKISKEIEDLQNDCNHLKKSLKSTKEYEVSSTFIIRWICDSCEKIVGIPNNEELNDYLKQ